MAMPPATRALLLCLCLPLGLPAGPAGAEQVVVTSQKPYWMVGPRDVALSRACALGRFNLARADRLVARFTGKEGAETLGVAKGTGVNLVDPDHKAKPTEDYYFRNQNTTSCEVFVGGRKGGAKPKG
jgi:hypothetical protein